MDMVRQKFDGDSVFISRTDTEGYSEPIRVRAIPGLIELHQQGTVELDAPAVRELVSELNDWLDGQEAEGGSSGTTPSTWTDADKEHAARLLGPNIPPDDYLPFGIQIGNGNVQVNHW